MKAIFAVSALAAAISGQALAADTEATITYNGAMEFDFIVDMAAETKDVELQKGNDANDGGSFGLYMDVEVVNGPFSGSRLRTGSFFGCFFLGYILVIVLIFGDLKIHNNHKIINNAEIVSI